MSAQPELRYTSEVYLELDRDSDERLEFRPCKLSLKEIYRNIKFGAGKNK